MANNMNVLHKKRTLRKIKKKKSKSEKIQIKREKKSKPAQEWKESTVNGDGTKLESSRLICRLIGAFDVRHFTLNPESDIPSGTPNAHPDCLKCFILVFRLEVHHTKEGLWRRDKRIERHDRLPLCPDPHPHSYLISIFTELISELRNLPVQAHFHPCYAPSSSLCSLFISFLICQTATNYWISTKMCHTHSAEREARMYMDGKEVGYFNFSLTRQKKPLHGHFYQDKDSQKSNKTIKHKAEDKTKASFFLDAWHFVHTFYISAKRKL